MQVLIPPQFSAATHAGPDRGAQLVHLGGETMGTTWSVACVSRTPEQCAVVVAGGIEALLADLLDQLSHWLPASAVGRYNRAPAGSCHHLPPDFSRVLDAALDIATLSDGAFDPTAGPLVDIWGFGPPGPRARWPEPAEIDIALARVGWQRLQRLPAGLLQPGGISLDFSAIAKGHAVDRLADWLDRAGFVHHLVEIGGELRGQGVKPDGTPWWVGIDTGDDPRSTGLITRIALDGLSIATSGSTWRQATHDGQCHAHTLDPRSGRPLTDAPTAVSVIHPLCREADGWSTALTVLGLERGLTLADALGLAVRYLIDGRAHCSRAWLAMVDDGAVDDHHAGG